jgi:hypothetical protein
MWFPSLLARWASKARPHRRPHPTRLALEQLEDRSLPSAYTAGNVAELIADINAANLKGGPNTITLAPHTLFSVTAVDNLADCPNGLPVIADGDKLTIVGNESVIERSTASGTPDFRLFDVSSRGRLTLENLTVRNGTATNAGGIVNFGTLDIDQCFLSGNVGDFGGAILNSGRLTVEQSTLSGNAAGAGGGGIFNVGTLDVDQCVLSDNSAEGGEGGGIMNAPGATLTVAGSIFAGNSANYGGGIEAIGTWKVVDSIFTGNFAFHGGGISAWSGGTIERSTFTNHFGGMEGGGIRFEAYSGILRMDHCTLTGNSADFGGGIFIASGVAAVDHTTLSGNSAIIVGGGMMLGEAGADVTINQCNFLDNTSLLGGGGGIEINGGALTINASNLTGNSAVDGSGGGIENTAFGTLTVKDSTIRNNLALQGADLFNDGSATLLASDVSVIDGNGDLTMH